MAKEKSAKKETEDWIQKKWRPMMAIMYMIVCVFDFIIFPIMFTVVQFWETEAANDAFRQWQPLTLVGAGLFHMAMGAVLGITAWSRGQEKIAGVAANGFNTPQSMPTTYGASATGGFSSGSNGNYATAGYTPQNGNYGQQSYSSYESIHDNISVTPVTGYKGKKAPVQPPDPVL
jgi:hypothetical protein